MTEKKGRRRLAETMATDTLAVTSSTALRRKTHVATLEAIQLFYTGNEGGAAASSSLYVPPVENDGLLSDQNIGGLENNNGSKNTREDDNNEVRAPLPVKRDVLYDTPMRFGATRLGYTPLEARTVVPFRNFEEELKHPGVWETDQGGGATSTADTSRDNLAPLYRPPFALMFHGPFEKAKESAKNQDRWLLVNLQSTKEFSSHMLLFYGFYDYVVY
ncbi:plant UBX domain-containing protein 7 [Lactuca sativa]|uniref:plant UBX domain-containing protein 7 n=1 Tax=Lactuca sativa TaxID=4236 RepID=UPI0022AEACD5|nr:plant UBX domain-containing protein 7 [Lactuca sativa]